MKIKFCSKCNQTKPVEEFDHRWERGPEARDSDCKDCKAIYNKEYRKRNREILKQQDRERYRDDPDSYRNAHRIYYQKNKEVVLATSKKSRDKLREGIFDILGWTCMCCGESAREFLTIDHIHGGRYGKDREWKRYMRSKRGPYGLYRDILKAGCPKDKYRTLCMNCNFSFGHWGYCPHQKKEG